MSPVERSKERWLYSQAACICQWLLFWQGRFAVLKYWNYVQLHCLNKIWIMQLGWTSCPLCKDKWWSRPALYQGFPSLLRTQAQVCPVHLLDHHQQSQRPVHDKKMMIWPKVLTHCTCTWIKDVVFGYWLLTLIPFPF